MTTIIDLSDTPEDLSEIDFSEGIGLSDYSITIGDLQLNLNESQFCRLYESMRKWWAEVPEDSSHP